ncbi:MAG TPA: alpha/beta fold hydrolase [Candidatus Paceibacterota bacterium]|nr:alpha/beta fold hydrolase [Candidatus Paceibacterota bacterium]
MYQVRIAPFPKMILHSTVHGSSPQKETLLLIHGMGSSASSAWRSILPSLMDRFTVVTLDLPGHGKSPIDKDQPMDPESLGDAVIRTMHHLKFEKFHSVGNSLGGWISLEMAAKYPERISSVTSLAPAGLWVTPFKTRYPDAAISQMLASSLRTVSPLLMRYEWARKIGFENVSPKWREFSYELCLDATTAMASSTGYYPAWEALLTKRFDKKIQPSIPVTIIFGDSDRTLPAETCQTRSLVPPHAKWMTLSECGHAPMWDHPDDVLELISITTGVL